MKNLAPIVISGRAVLPLIEGGKGISISKGESSGAWAAANCVGTFSCINADFSDDAGKIIRHKYSGATRRQRFEELVAFAIKGGIQQARIAHEKSNGKGRIHLNTLWEAAGTERILHSVLEGAKGLVHGITCGAGMPYRMAEIAAKFNVYYYPIVSSARAFNALWKRAYHKFRELLGGVVYEDPWLAGGHTGLSNSENYLNPQTPYPRVKKLRDSMRENGLEKTPIIMAGGVWFLRDWQDWIDNDELGPIAFQFGTRPLLTKESPICDAWKKKLLSLKEGDIQLNKFSPTGFFSSAVNNRFLKELVERNERLIEYRRVKEDGFTAALAMGARGRNVYLKPEDKARAERWMASGFTEGMKTPDSTLIFVAKEKAAEIINDQQSCMGCLSTCRFSNWSTNDEGTTGKLADPRTFCIQKTLQEIAHGGDIDENLMFAGRNAFMFAKDPFYNSGFIPTVQQLVNRLLTGD